MKLISTNKECKYNILKRLKIKSSSVKIDSQAFING